MINREDMLELTRRMTPARNCFDRIAGAYVNDMGEIEDTFNIHIGKLSAADKAKNLALAKAVPFSRTNEQLKEYVIPKEMKVPGGMWQLLRGILECGLKNDALMDVLYEQLADGYPVDHEFAIYVFHGVYDVPLKASDKESLWESEEIYDFMICIISPLKGEYDPDEPVFGFLYPAFKDRSEDRDRMNIFHKNPWNPEEGLLYKLVRKTN
jgi:hypothetical protein